LLAVVQPAAIPYALFLAAGLAFAIPFAIVTAWPAFGALAARVGIGRLPEETTRPEALAFLELSAIRPTASSPLPSSV
jgi:membrane glycosyltransferase